MELHKPGQAYWTGWGHQPSSQAPKSPLLSLCLLPHSCSYYSNFLDGTSGTRLGPEYLGYCLPRLNLPEVMLFSPPLIWHRPEKQKNVEQNNKGSSGFTDVSGVGSKGVSVLHRRDRWSSCKGAPGKWHSWNHASACRRRGLCSPQLTSTKVGLGQPLAFG